MSMYLWPDAAIRRTEKRTHQQVLSPHKIGGGEGGRTERNSEQIDAGIEFWEGKRTMDGKKTEMDARDTSTG